jgi:large subunit ribosomal protein L13
VRTFTEKKEGIERQWYVVDAEGQTLGRLASRIAPILKGKHKPTYSPHLDCGDFVIIVNAEKVRVTGQKLDQKLYYHHSGYPGARRASACGINWVDIRNACSSPRFAGCCQRTSWGGG